MQRFCQQTQKLPRTFIRRGNGACQFAQILSQRKPPQVFTQREEDLHRLRLPHEKTPVAPLQQVKAREGKRLRRADQTAFRRAPVCGQNARTTPAFSVRIVTSRSLSPTGETRSTMPRVSIRLVLLLAAAALHIAKVILYPSCFHKRSPGALFVHRGALLSGAGCPFLFQYAPRERPQFVVNN